MSNLAKFPKLVFVVTTARATISHLEIVASSLYGMVTDLPAAEVHAVMKQHTSYIYYHDLSASGPSKEDLLKRLLPSATQGVKVLVIAEGNGAALVQDCLESSVLMAFVKKNAPLTGDFQMMVENMKNQLVIVAVDGSKRLRKDLTKTTVNILSVEEPYSNDQEEYEEEDETGEIYFFVKFRKPANVKSSSGILSCASSSSGLKLVDIAMFLLKPAVMFFIAAITGVNLNV